MPEGCAAQRAGGANSARPLREALGDGSAVRPPLPGGLRGGGAIQAAFLRGARRELLVNGAGSVEPSIRLLLKNVGLPIRILGCLCIIASRDQILIRDSMRFL